jgi:hypothetical protein
MKKTSKMDELTESQFHTVWTEAVGVEGYDKRMFQNLFQKMVENGTVLATGCCRLSGLNGSS